MDKHNNILDRIVEEFYDTGRLVLNEQNEVEEGVTTYDIEEYVNDLTIPEIEEDLSFLSTRLNDKDKESVEVNNIDVINYLKDEDEGITLKDKNLENDAKELLCNSLGGGGIEDYIEQIITLWREHNTSENNKTEYLRYRNEMFCQYWNDVLSKCDTNEKFFKYCKPIKLSIDKRINEQNDPVVDIESQIEDNINNGEEYSNLRNRRYNLYSALNHFNVANNLIIRLLRDEELSEEDFERYLELGDSLERRMVNITNLIRRQQNQTNQEGETENVPEDEEDEVVVDDPNEDEIEITDLDSEEGENTGVEGNEDEEDEEETVTIEHNLFDLFKNNVKDKNILYGQWEIKEIEDDSVILKRVNVTNSDKLENLLFELSVDDVEVSIEDLKNKIGDEKWKKYEDAYKNTILKKPSEFTTSLSRKIFTSGKKVKSWKTVNDLFDKANLIIDNIILYLKTNEKWQKDSTYIEYHNKLLKLITTYTDRNSSTKELDLYEIVYDLYQLYERIKDNGKNVLNKKLMDKLFSGEFNKIRDVFNEVRKNNNLDYELSFQNTCEIDPPFFEKVTDNSTILDVNQLPEEYQIRKKWNQYLKSKIQSTATTESIIQEFSGMLMNGVDKYDLITKRTVTLTSLNGGESLEIPEGRKVEVKKIKHKNRKGEYKDYVMSEFLSLYKNEDPESPEDKIRYGEIINGILSGITGTGGIGDEVIKTMTNTDNGILGIFYENYIFIPMNYIDVRWGNRGHGKGAEDRISLRIKISETPNIYVWKEGNPNCDERFYFDGCTPETVCPQNESTDRIDNIIENFFDTGNFDI